MPQALETAAQHAASPIARAAPDWALVPFDVACARCGQDLRGLTEPRCPACGLEFEWSQAVPLEHLVCRNCDYQLYGLSETRCPECGQAFTWADVLDDYHRKRKPLFEYHWRDEPIRSLIRTWWMALRPRRFWRRLDLHDPPNDVALVAFFAIGLATTVAFVTFLISALDIVGELAMGLPWSDVPRELLRFLEGFVIEPEFLIGLAVVISSWWLGTLLGLVVLTESMRRCKVRAVHAVRACAYALVPALPIAALLLVMLLPWSGFLGSSRRAELLGLSPPLLLAAYATWHIRNAYRFYIRMPHSLGVALASQAVGVLTALNVSLLFSIRW